MTLTLVKLRRAFDICSHGRLPIVCANGIGDSLLILGRVPIDLLGRLGFRFNIYYTGSSHTRAIIAPFLSSIKFCRYTPFSPSRLQCFLFSKLLSLFARTHRIFRPPFLGNDPSKPKRRNSGLSIQDGKRILLHTHLDQNLIDHGLTAKLWPLENWIHLCHSLHNNHWQVSILEWNDEMREAIMMSCPFVLDGRHANESSLYASFSQYNCLFSVDSWSKYVAAWFRVPQVIVVPDLRVGYAGFDDITATQFASWWLHGILSMPHTLVLGLVRTGTSYDYSLPAFRDLGVPEALAAIHRVHQSALESQRGAVSV